MSGFLGQLARALAWPPERVIAMIWAYYDESGEYGPDGALLNMSIGGCVARLEAWEKFTDQWRTILDREGLPFFHMTDFEAWRAPFDFACADGGRDNKKHNALLNSLIEVMLTHVIGFYAFTAGNVISPDRRAAHRLSLEDCTLSAVGHAVNTLWNDYQEPINLVFGKQKHFGSGKMLECVQLYDFEEGRGRIKTATVADPADVLPLQAADILVYEIAREQRGRTRRYPFTALLDGCKERGIPMTLKYASIIRVSDRVALERRADGKSKA